jgi:tetratricopeptide (TPR) repeat protein
MADRLGNKIKELHHRGMDAYEQGDYEVARTLLKEVITLNPRMADVLNKLGVMASLDGNLYEAVEYLQRAVALNPTYSEAALNLTITFNELGESDKAYEVFANLSSAQNLKEGELDPFAAGKLANEHYRIGNIYMEFNRLPQAIEEFRKALSLRDGLSDVQTKLGTALRESGQPEEAITVLKKALETNQHYGHAWVQLGLAYYGMGLHTDARNVWLEALEKVPDLKEVQTLLNIYEHEE